MNVNLLGGSLRFVQLPALVQLLADLGSTGQLHITHARWAGAVEVRGGQIVAATLGAERDRAALESIALGLIDGEFRFSEEPVTADADALVSRDEARSYIEALVAEARRLAERIPSLAVRPRLIDTPVGDAADAQVTVPTAALQLVPALVAGHTLEEIARQRGIARTLRDLVGLLDGGLVSLEPAPAAAEVAAHAAAPTVPARPPAMTRASLARSVAVSPPRVAPAEPQLRPKLSLAGVRAKVVGFFVAEESPSASARLRRIIHEQDMATSPTH